MNRSRGNWANYAVVMGNSGGDNRVEFGTRLEHSIVYESPKMYGVSFDFLVSPGQNRTYDAVVQSSGSPDCSGGNIPGSGNLPAKLRRWRLYQRVESGRQVRAEGFLPDGGLRAAQQRQSQQRRYRLEQSDLWLLLRTAGRRGGCPAFEQSSAARSDRHHGQRAHQWARRSAQYGWSWARIRPTSVPSTHTSSAPSTSSPSG